MSEDIDNLERLRVAAKSQHLPADLGRWVVQRLTDLLPAAKREAAAVRLMRAAGAAVGGSIYRQATELSLIAEKIRASAGAEVCTGLADAIAVDLVRRALDHHPSMGISRRQLQRLLA